MLRARRAGGGDDLGGHFSLGPRGLMKPLSDVFCARMRIDGFFCCLGDVLLLMLRLGVTIERDNEMKCVRAVFC